jgi:hypothetical protein
MEKDRSATQPLLPLTSQQLERYHRILSHGLSAGLGRRGGMICIEAAICQVLGLPHGDKPGCVASEVQVYVIALNDAAWSSPMARASGMRNLGLAQLGSRGIVESSAFYDLMAKKTIKTIIPALFREIFPMIPECLKIADRCALEGSTEAAFAAAGAIGAPSGWPTFFAKEASMCASFGAASSAATYATKAVTSEALWKASWVDEVKEGQASVPLRNDKYLLLSAQLAVEALTELGSPGCGLLPGDAA